MVESKIRDSIREDIVLRKTLGDPRRQFAKMKPYHGSKTIMLEVIKVTNYGIKLREPRERLRRKDRFSHRR